MNEIIKRYESQEIKVSYIIPSFNHGKYIKRAIDSVLNQTYKNIELIVCDDCSTDGTLELLEDYSKQKGFFLYRNEHNMGASQTTQHLIDIATGEYICMLASDDWVKPCKVEKQLIYMLENQLDGVLGPLVKYYEEENRYEEKLDSVIEGIVNQGRTLKNIYKKGVGGGLLQSGMFRTECVKSVGFLEGYKSDDFLFQIRFLQAGYKLGYLNQAFTFYRIHNSNSHADVMYCLEELELPVIRNFIPEQYRARREAGAYASAALKALSNGDFQQSLGLQKESLKRKVYFENCFWFVWKDLRYLLIKLKIYPFLYRMVFGRKWKNIK